MSKPDELDKILTELRKENSCSSWQEYCDELEIRLQAYIDKAVAKATQALEANIKDIVNEAKAEELKEIPLRPNFLPEYITERLHQLNQDTIAGNKVYINELIEENNQMREVFKKIENLGNDERDANQ
jgi:hypothetical protein